MKNVTRITTFIYRGREFYILKADAVMICGVAKRFWGIESKYFENGKLTIEVNGIAGNLSATVAECIESIKVGIDIDYIAETENCSKMEAIERYYMSALNA